MVKLWSCWWFEFKTVIKTLLLVRCYTNFHGSISVADDGNGGKKICPLADRVCAASWGFLVFGSQCRQMPAPRPECWFSEVQTLSSTRCLSNWLTMGIKDPPVRVNGFKMPGHFCCTLVNSSTCQWFQWCGWSVCVQYILHITGSVKYAL